MRQKAASASFLLAIFCVIFLLSMMCGFSHDERQFVSSGKLLADGVGLPYVDYLYFQTPNLVLLYALIFKFTSWLLLGARISSAIFTWIILALIFSLVYKLFEKRSPWLRFIAAASAVLILLSNPVFISASVLAWNHPLPLLASLLAFIFHIKAYRGKRSAVWVFLSGLSLGIASGARLYYAILLIPLFLTIFFFPQARARVQRVRLVLSFMAGFFLAMVPSFVFLLMAPEKFIFDIYFYHAYLDKLYLMNAGRFTPFISRIGNCFDALFAAKTAPLTIVFLCAIVIGLVKPVGFDRDKHRFEFNLALWFVVFTLINALCLKIVTFAHIFSASMPFMALAVFYVIASLDEKGVKEAAVVLCLTLVLSAIYLAGELQKDKDFISPYRWRPVESHLRGEKMAALAGKGKMLTLSTIFPLEGGIKIYKEFASAPFSWRVSKLVNKGDRARFNFISEDELADFLKKEPPESVLTGFNGGQDDIFFSYARNKNFRRIRVESGDLFIRDGAPHKK